MLRAFVFAACLALGAGSAAAQTYPARTIEMVVPFPAGANSDIAARALADAMAKMLGQPLVVSNKDGAAGAIGTAAVARLN